MMRYPRMAVVALFAVGCGRTAPPAGEPSPNSRPDAATAASGAATACEHRDIMLLTPAAAERLAEIMKGSGAVYLRILLDAQQQYKLDMTKELDPENDLLGNSRGVAILVDRQNAAGIPVGMRLDFVNESGRQGFVFSAPEMAAAPAETQTLPEARQGFRTRLARRSVPGPAPESPPAGVFQLVHYSAPTGKLAAYLTPDPQDGLRHATIVWITGGDCNSIDDVWTERAEENDQSARAYRAAGITMLFPSLRGGNDNPGAKEGFLGEVDDVLSAAKFLRKQPFVDPQRVYLGGHSTGGTLALLTSECSDTFRAVFCFGPVSDVIGYGPRYNPFDFSEPDELRLRAPIRWLHGVRSPTFVIEGTQGNLSELRGMAEATKNPQIRFLEVPGADHFQILAPINRLIAEQILNDTEAECRIQIDQKVLNSLFAN
jgi:Fe-S cluster assembly iron-binding protein IscA/pimeloyl-ACP methyl ester carboxylesterase